MNILKKLFKNRTNELSLDGTWHECRHQFKVEAIDYKRNTVNFTEQKCTKCNVSATTRFGELTILINPESNAPFVLAPWDIGRPTPRGICLTPKSNDPTNN